MNSSGRLELQFFDDKPGSWRQCLVRCLEGYGRSVRLQPWNEQAEALVKAAEEANLGASFCVARGELGGRDVPQTVSVVDDDAPCDGYALSYGDPDDLSAALLAYLDLPAGIVMAPKTAHHFSRRQVYPLSIPKAGTHVVLGLLRLFGLSRAAGTSGQSKGGSYTYLERDEDAHTPFTPFFTALPWDHPEGRKHPFLTSPAVFIYRHPLDILLSEADYMRRPERSAFSHIFAGLSMEETCRLLMRGPLGSLADRVLAYSGWLYCPNVIPVSFEELVGPKGGGDAEEQKRLIWSLQLKLHVPGDPETYGDKVFDPKSPTFRRGQIGGFKAELTRADYRAVKKLEKATSFMAEYGYDLSTVLPPRNAYAYRRRPLDIHPPVETGLIVPILVETGYKGFNIIAMRGSFYGISHRVGECNLAELTDEDFAAMQADHVCVIASSQEEARRAIDGLPPGRITLAYGRTTPGAGTSAETIDSPVLVEDGYKGFNIVAMRGSFYGISHRVGECDLAELTDEDFAAMQADKTCVIASSQAEARRLIDQIGAGQ